VLWILTTASPYGGPEYGPTVISGTPARANPCVSYAVG